MSTLMFVWVMQMLLVVVFIQLMITLRRIVIM